MLTAATATIAEMMTDLRRVTRARAEAEQAATDAGSGPGERGRAVDRLRKRARRAVRAGRRLVGKGSERG
jgi:hypothetical protein